MSHKEKVSGSGANVFWGVVFTAMAFVELSRRMLVVSGIPVWAICFLAVGIGNFLKVPRIASAIAGSEERAVYVGRLASILNIVGLAVLLISIAVAYLI